MPEGDGSSTNMSIHAITGDEVNDTISVNKSNEESMAEPSKMQETHREEYVKTNIIRFCAFVVAKPKLSFGKCSVGKDLYSCCGKPAYVP